MEAFETLHSVAEVISAHSFMAVKFCLRDFSDT